MLLLLSAMLPAAGPTWLSDAFLYLIQYKSLFVQCSDDNQINALWFRITICGRPIFDWGTLCNSPSVDKITSKHRVDQAQRFLITFMRRLLLSFAMRTTKIRKARRLVLIVITVSGILIASIDLYNAQCHSYWCFNIQHLMHFPVDHLKANWLKPLYNLQVGYTR